MANGAIDRGEIRRQRLTGDVELIIRSCASDNDCPFHHFILKDDHFSFEYHKGSTKVFYWIVVTDEYPDQSVMTVSENSPGSRPTTEFICERLPVMFNRLAAKMYKNLNLVVKSDYDLKKCMNPRLRPPLSARDYYADSDDDVDTDDDVYCSAVMESDDDCDNVDEELMHDIENARKQRGSHTVNCRFLKSIDMVDIELHVPTAMLDVEVASAWKLRHGQPIVIVLQLRLSNYRSGSEPSVSVHQMLSTNDKMKSGVHKQLEKITQEFVTQNWSKSEPPSSSQLNSSSEMQLDVDVQSLCNLGYSQQQAETALNASGSDVNIAAELLLEFGDAVTEIYPNTSSDVAAASHRRAVSPSTSIASTKRLKTCNDDVKTVPTSEHGFLVQVILYAEQRLQTLNEFCVVCDERHLFESAHMIKPTVCCRELCSFAFQTLGVMADAADEVATATEVVDLLISMAKAAVRSQRRNLIFDPYPSVVNPSDSQKLAFNPNAKDFDKVSSTLDCFVPMSELVKLNSTQIKQQMDIRSNLAYPLLQWIISSNRSHIVKLPPAKQLKFMETPHQFLLRSSPPSKEAAFVKARRKHGSTFAFHGSLIENWHSIVRHGLISASGTQHQLNGAMLGQGVYLSPNSSKSFMYCSRKQRQSKYSQTSHSTRSEDSRFLTSDNIMCIALCEVVTSKKLKKSGNIWVMPDADQVCTRFFFVYNNSDVHHCFGVNSQDKHVTDAVTKLVHDS